MNEAREALSEAKKVVVIQAENPDGDSLASALALESILTEKEVTLYCAVDIPKYLRYMEGWDRVSNEIPADFDLSIIVDAATSPLLEKTYEAFGKRLGNTPSIVFDHHVSGIDLNHPVLPILDDKAVSTGEVIYSFFKDMPYDINPQAANFLAISIMADTLGLSTQGVTATSVHVLAELIEKGANLAAADEARRERMTKSFEIFKYKGRLFERVDLHLDGRLASVTIPWEEIEEYSDQYNPSMLIIDEMRLIDGVQIAVALKTYPDGKITAKIRANSSAPIAHLVAGHFGGGGHPYAAGFKLYDTPVESIRKELTATVLKQLQKIKS